MSDERESVKKTNRQATRKDREGESLSQAENFINQVFTRGTQRTVRYLRWLEKLALSGSSLEPSCRPPEQSLGHFFRNVFYTDLLAGWG